LEIADVIGITFLTSTNDHNPATRTWFACFYLIGDHYGGKLKPGLIRSFFVLLDHHVGSRCGGHRVLAVELEDVGLVSGRTDYPFSKL
jgi:hypothetical protein